MKHISEFRRGENLGQFRVMKAKSHALWLRCWRCEREHWAYRTERLRCPHCWQKITGTIGQMRQRCYNPDNKKYADYGGRGIKICPRWRHNTQAFFEDMDYPVDMSHSIDRIDVNGNYEPSNCRWATKSEQALNTRRAKITPKTPPIDMPPLPQMVTTDVAAKFLDLPASTIRTYCDREILRSKVIGRTILVHSKSLIAYAKRRKKPGRPKKEENISDNLS